MRLRSGERSGFSSPLVALAIPDNLAAKTSGRVYRTMNHRIEPRRITAARIDGDFQLASGILVS
jgi:hypothetical protein